MSEKAVILIVDDSATNIQMTAALLKDKYRLKVATDGERCLELALSDPVPDLILLDVVMPKMDGYEVCRKLKESQLTRDIPVIFVTGRNEEEDEEYGLTLGAVDYVAKPIRPIILEARVDTHVTLKVQRDQLTNLAMRDQLTGAYNRHYLVEDANRKVSEAQRFQSPLSLLMLDIDHFKVINDQYGHQTGDRVLKSVAKVIQKQCRQEDSVARFGGEEFVILMPHCDMDQAKEKAENIRQSLIKLRPFDIEVTVSIGVAELSSKSEKFEALLSRADSAVYQAKENGRNNVCSQIV
ncbi:GGDEF domain-containing response regulator [Aliikangiella coralliicola]|uniref:diguanylate cyclase n=1 Tax=Aliikangiella coralliicola TaxID=2592383 RepID=A0A545UCL4_9GAMM|nr:diguanylate cyclase [Aliikangiella coralliicola]TQV87209.1 diguanylate cyclase [Aliikangiella coralliicola]